MTHFAVVNLVIMFPQKRYKVECSQVSQLTLEEKTKKELSFLTLTE